MKKGNKMVAIILVLVFFLNNSFTAKGLVYKTCPETYIWPGESTSTDSSYPKDEKGKYREYGLKLSEAHKNTCSDTAKFYKRGYSDYNCLAYALKDNSVNAWTWPWKETPNISDVKAYLSKKGYKYYFPVGQYSRAAGDIIFIYGRSTSEITHFARRYNLANKKVDGAITISKWGYFALYTSSSYSPYQDYSYGECIGMCSTSVAYSTK